MAGTISKLLDKMKEFIFEIEFFNRYSESWRTRTGDPETPNRPALFEGRCSFSAASRGFVHYK